MQPSFPVNMAYYCSAWLRLKLNTKMRFKHHHPPTHQELLKLILSLVWDIITIRVVMKAIQAKIAPFSSFPWPMLGVRGDILETKTFLNVKEGGRDKNLDSIWHKFILPLSNVLLDQFIILLLQFDWTIPWVLEAIKQKFISTRNWNQQRIIT